MFKSKRLMELMLTVMPGDLRDRIDQMKNRIDFVTPARQAEFPYLSILLDAAIQQKVLFIDYDSREGMSSREIQPIGIYASNGFWYCPAYCFLKSDFRLFRCDKIHTAVYNTSTAKPLDLRHVHLGNRKSFIKLKQENIGVYIELSKEGVQRCEAELWPVPKLHIRKDGTGWLDGDVPKSEISYFTKFFIGLGSDATVKNPPELVDSMKRVLSEIIAKYV